MALAIKSFIELKADKKVFILGDMLELGEKSGFEHKKILDMLVQHKDEHIFLVGAEFQKVGPEFGFKSFHDARELSEYLKNEPLRGSSVLIKGSRRIGLEMIYDLL